MAEGASRTKKQAHESDRKKSNITVGKQVLQQQNRDTNSNLIKNNPSNEMVSS